MFCFIFEYLKISHEKAFLLALSPTSPVPGVNGATSLLNRDLLLMLYLSRTGGIGRLFFQEKEEVLQKKEEESGIVFAYEIQQYLLESYFSKSASTLSCTSTVSLQ